MPYLPTSQPVPLLRLVSRPAAPGGTCKPNNDESPALCRPGHVGDDLYNVPGGKQAVSHAGHLLAYLVLRDVPGEDALRPRVESTRGRRLSTRGHRRLTACCIAAVWTDVRELTGRIIGLLADSTLGIVVLTRVVLWLPDDGLSRVVPVHLHETERHSAWLLPTLFAHAQRVQRDIATGATTARMASETVALESLQFDTY